MTINICHSCRSYCRGYYCRQCANKINPPAKGHKVTDETKELIAQKLKENIPWNKGLKTGNKPHNWNGGRYVQQGYVCDTIINDSPHGYITEYEHYPTRDYAT